MKHGVDSLQSRQPRRCGRTGLQCIEALGHADQLMTDLKSKKRLNREEQSIAEAIVEGKAVMRAMLEGLK